MFLGLAVLGIQPLFPACPCTATIIYASTASLALPLSFLSIRTFRGPAAIEHTILSTSWALTISHTLDVEKSDLRPYVRLVEANSETEENQVQNQASASSRSERSATAGS